MRILLAILCAAFRLAADSQAQPPKSAFISQLLENAEARIKKSPATAEGYNDLAFALARRWRETEDSTNWQRAEQAIATALKLDGGNFDARKARVLIRIQQRRFADAEEEARVLNKQTPDDNLLYGYLADIAIALGNYPEAERLAQRMVDLRQVNGPGLQRAAKVREMIGFPDGAVEFWNSALRLASSADVEERAFILTQLAGLCRRWAKLEEASRYAEQALTLEPEYPAALEEQGRIALVAGKTGLAEIAFSKRLAQGEWLPTRYWLSETLRMQKKEEASQEAAALFLKQARAAERKPENWNGLLMRYLTRQGKAAEAVAVGDKTVVRGTDMETRQEYAVALLESGDAQAAWVQMDQVLKPGVQNPEYFLNAGRIQQKNGNQERARWYLKKCIEANANSPYAETAFRELQNAAAMAP